MRFWAFFSVNSRERDRERIKKGEKSSHFGTPHLLKDSLRSWERRKEEVEKKGKAREGNGGAEEDRHGLG